MLSVYEPQCSALLCEISVVAQHYPKVFQNLTMSARQQKLVI